MERMEPEQKENVSFVQERLNSLSEIDQKVSSFLNNTSNLFKMYPQMEKDSIRSKEDFTEQIKSIYGLISNIAIELRKEVKIMDENIGVSDQNKDNIMILPIKVDQKNTSLGKDKLNDEVNELEKLLTKRGEYQDKDRENFEKVNEMVDDPNENVKLEEDEDVKMDI